MCWYTLYDIDDDDGLTNGASGILKHITLVDG